MIPGNHSESRIAKRTRNFVIRSGRFTGISESDSPGYPSPFSLRNADLLGVEATSQQSGL
jgi:hypothetical protein